MALALALNWYTSPTPLVGTRRPKRVSTKFAFGEAEFSQASAGADFGETSERVRRSFGGDFGEASASFGAEFGEASELSSANLRR